MRWRWGLRTPPFVLMDIKAGNPYPAGALSNFAHHPFVFRDIHCESMEGLLQSLKFKDPEMQKHICTLHGKKAKMSGKEKNWQKTQTLWWQGQPIKRSSKEYQQILDEAYGDLFSQNEKARNALLATNDATLTHSIGWHKKNDTVLTRQEFCSRLMNIRSELKTIQYLEY